MKIAIIRLRPRNLESKEEPFQEYVRKLTKREAIIRKNFGRSVPPEQAEAIFEISGDGPFVATIKQYVHLGVPFYGDNHGTYGFLLNTHEDGDDFVAALKNAVWIEFPFLHVELHYTNGSVEELLAFNDVFTKTFSGECSRHRVFVNGENYMPQVRKNRETIFQADGINVCAAGGSTGYNRSLNGKIFSPEENLIGIAPIVPFPIRVPPITVPDNVEITIEIIDGKKTRQMVFVDGAEYADVTKIVVRKADGIKATLGFKPGETHSEKLLKLEEEWRQEEAAWLAHWTEIVMKAKKQPEGG